MDWQSLTPTRSWKQLKTDKEHGISEMQAEKRREVYGENKLAEKKKKNLFFVSLRNSPILWY